MATYTTYYELIKPGTTDLVNVGDLNDNFDIIDEELHKAAQSAGVEMTFEEYEDLTDEEKMDGTIRFITDVNSIPSAEGVEF